MKQKTNLKAPEILLVEDNNDDLELVKGIFKKNNITNSILHLERGEDALDYLFQKGAYSETTSSNTPKVIMLDINLPKMNGLDILRRVRSNPKTENIPVFVFTSSVSDYNIFESYRLGIASYIRKETNFEKFEEAVMQVAMYLREYRILILEDNECDAELLKFELDNSTLQCICRVATNKEEYINALNTFKPDIIFSDYDLVPNFDAIQANRILREKGLNIPFVLVTGKLGDEFAASCLTEGMDDYLLKGQLKRFPITLMNRLRMKKIEEERGGFAERIKENEAELRTLFESIDEVFFTVDMQENKVIHISSACEKVFGYSKDRLLHDSVLWKQLILPAEINMYTGDLQNLIKGKTVVTQDCINHANGEERWVQRKIIPNMDLKGRLKRVYGVIADITDQKNATENLAKSEMQVKNFARYLNQVLEDERASIAREMHDELGQQLAAFKLGLSMLSNKFENDNEGKENIKKLMKEVDNTIQSMREIVTLLRPSILDTFGLVPSLEWLATEFEKKSGVPCKFEKYVDQDTFEKDVSTCFFRICQEALTNISKHAGASKVNIYITQDQNNLTLRVNDNGKGIVSQKLQNPFSMGLLGMRERSACINGDFKITSEKGSGTTVYLKAAVNRTAC